MDTTYTMIGADGQQYGPITLEQVRAWIREQRITANTQIQRSDVNTWLPASQYAELGLTPTGVTSPSASGIPAPLPTVNNTVTPLAAAQARIGARWFYWIAGLSLINTLIAMSKAGVVFLVGLGLTQFIDSLTGGMESGKIVGLVLNLVVVGMFAMFGYFASKGHNWSFITGMILYFLDAGLMLLVWTMAGFGVPWLSLVFHAFVLFRIFTGLQANMKLKAAQRGVA